MSRESECRHDRFYCHIGGNPAAGINHTFPEIDLVPEGISNHFVEGVVPADVFTGKKEPHFFGREDSCAWQRQHCEEGIPSAKVSAIWKIHSTSIHSGVTGTGGWSEEK